MAELPDWTPFDPSAPPTLPDLEDGPGRVVAVVATFVATTLGWAASVAAELAAGWSALGHRVVLADGGLVEPQLHEVFGESNGEGVTDAVLYGASIRRVARPVRGGTFFLVCAGTAVADPGQVLSSPRWTRLCAGFRRAGVTLVIFVSPDEPALRSALDQASDVVVLAGPDEDVSSLVDGVGGVVRGVVGVDAAAVPTVSDDAPVEPEADGSWESALGADSELDDSAPPSAPADPWAAAAQAVAEPSAEPWVAPVSRLAEDESAQELPAWTAEARKHEARAEALERSQEVPETEEVEGSRHLLRLVLMVVVFAIVGAAAFGLVEIPGLPAFPWISPSAEEEAPPESLTPVATSVLQPETTPLMGYSVTVGAFQDLGVARARREQLAVGQGTFLAMAPVEIDGTVFHRLLVGPAQDSAEAVGLLARVAQASGLNASDLIVRATPLAFELGEVNELEAAARRAEVLRGLDVPAYVLAVEYADGAVRYRVYAGAYADETEARYLLGLLAERLVNSAVLRQRTGRLPE